MMKYFIQQIKEKDCGFACLKILMANVHKNKDYLYYPQDIDDHSYSLAELIKIAKDEKITLKAYRFIKKSEIKNEKIFPILTVCKANQKLHMVVLYKIRKNNFYIFDPIKGKIKLKERDFYEIWTGEALINLGVVKNKYHAKKNNIKETAFILGSSIVQVISFAALATGLYFINDKISFIIPILLFLAYFLFELLYKQVSIIGMKFFDKKVYKNLESTQRMPNKFFEDISFYKTLFFSTPIQLISIGVSIVLFVILLGLNSYLNLINIGLVVVINLFMNFGLKMYQERRKNDSYLGFLSIDYSENQNIRKLKVLNDVTYKSIDALNLKNYVILFLIITLCLFYASLTNNVSINFVLFHVFSYFFLNELLNNFIGKIDNLKKIDEYKCLYLNYFSNL